MERDVGKTTQAAMKGPTWTPTVLKIVAPNLLQKPDRQLVYVLSEVKVASVTLRLKTAPKPYAMWSFGPKPSK